MIEHFFNFKILNTLIFLYLGNIALAQQYDILIKGAHLIDAKNNIDKIMDVAISDAKIAEVAPQISSSGAKKIIDARG